MGGRLLDRAEAARVLAGSERTIRRLGRAGHLTEVRVFDRAIRIDADSIAAHIAARRVVHGSEGSDAA